MRQYYSYIHSSISPEEVNSREALTDRGSGERLVPLLVVVDGVLVGIVGQGSVQLGVDDLLDWTLAIS
jgi:hypothetical protein